LERLDAGQCRIAEVEFSQHQRSYERLEDRAGQRATNGMQLPQDSEALRNSS